MIQLAELPAWVLRQSGDTVGNTVASFTPQEAPQRTDGAFTAVDLRDWLRTSATAPAAAPAARTAAGGGGAPCEATQPDTHAAVDRFDGMVLEEHLGSGSTAQVFTARLATSDERVAVKILCAATSHQLSELTAEVQLAMSLHHVFICETLGTAVASAASANQMFPALIMELVDGGTLEQLIRTGAGFSSPASVPPCDVPCKLSLIPLKSRLARELAEAVAYLHSKGVLHGDLKPANVLLTKGITPHIKLCDFGVATHLSIVRRAERFGVRGTPRYMAPEVAFRAYDKSADIYSYGVILFELLHERRFLSYEGCHTALDILLYVQLYRPPTQLTETQLNGADEAEAFARGRGHDRGVLDAFIGVTVVHAMWRDAWLSIQRLPRLGQTMCKRTTGRASRAKV